MKYKEILILLPLFCFLLSLTSCRSMVLSLVADKSFKQAHYLKDTINNREVIILPMVHVGSKEHYARVKKYLDQMKEEGFVTFYEGIDIERDSLGGYDTLKADTLRRRMRRVVGQDIFAGYTNPENNSIPKSSRSGKYVAQRDSDIGLVTDQDFLVDMKLGQIISKYESQYKPITLSDYDWQTDFLQPYKRDNPKEHSMFVLLNSNRTDYMVEQILASEHKKIIVIYGVSHLWHINGGLRQQGKFIWDRKFNIKKFK